METKLIVIAIAMVSLAFVLLLMFGFGRGALQGLTMSDEEKNFVYACIQWKNRGCGMDTLAEIDKSQEFWGDPTVTDACKKKFPINDTSDCSGPCATQKSLLLCRDSCNNGCYEQLYYNLAAYPDFIIRHLDRSITFYVNNTGTASVWGVEISVFNDTSGSRFCKVTKDIQAKNSTSILCPSSDCPVSTCGNSVKIIVDPDNKIKEDNENDNYAEKNWG